jgi:hypothetical protein
MAALSKDEESATTTDDIVGACFSCGRTYIYRRGRFCSERCREWFDAGNQPYDRTCGTKSNARGFDLALGECRLSDGLSRLWAAIREQRVSLLLDPLRAPVPGAAGKPQGNG